MDINVLLLVYHPANLTDELYHKALALVDEDSQIRIRKFYRRADAARTLLGRLMIKSTLRSLQFDHEQVKFDKTDTGKPFMTSTPGFAYNITHDNGVVGMAYGLNRSCLAPAYGIGIDVMMVRQPGREQPFLSFVSTFDDQLTFIEREQLRDVNPQEGLRRFFWMWTAKEAYTKALGLGLGFEFSRVEYDVVGDLISVDGVKPLGWSFHKFEVVDGEDDYVGMVAEYRGEGGECLIDWIEEGQVRRMDAIIYVTRLLQELGDAN